MSKARLIFSKQSKTKQKPINYSKALKKVF